MTALLSVALVATLHAPPSWCVRWLTWLFPCGPKRPGIERTAVLRRDATITETYRVRWTSDGRGNPDSLVFTATAVPQPPIVRRVANPAFPLTLSVTWQDPPLGDSLVTQGCARVQRRALVSSLACSPTRTYRSVDVAPPPPVVDTTVQIAAFWMDPRGTLSLSRTDSLELCSFVRFADGAVATSRDAQVGRCAVRLAVYQQGRLPTVAQQQVADTACGPLPGVSVGPWSLRLWPGQTGPIGRLRVAGPHTCRAWLYAS